MIIRDLINILEGIEDLDQEILIETSDGLIDEVELVEPEEYDEDNYGDEEIANSYKLVATNYV